MEGEELLPSHQRVGNKNQDQGADGGEAVGLVGSLRQKLNSMSNTQSKAQKPAKRVTAVGNTVLKADP